MEDKKEEASSKEDPFIFTFENSNKQKKNKEDQKSSEKQKTMSKHHSEPKFKSYKEEILKIPKVKQILNMDKYVYNQDIEKRL